MQNQWLVSVIIPVYNVRQYLRESLDSVLHQTYHNLEIIIVDDGSTDGSGEICDEYAQRDDRVIVIHQENRGLSAARNAGLDRMTGDLASFLDPDDAYASQYIELMVSAMMKEDVDLVICRFTVHHTAGHLSYPGNGKDISMVIPGLYDRAGAQRALIDNNLNVSAWNKLYRRSLWTGLRFPEGHVYEDIDTTYRIFDRCQSIRCLNQPLYMHRRRAGSITHTVSADNIRDWHLAMEHFESYIAAHTPEIFSPEHLRQHRQKRLRRMISDYINYVSRCGSVGDAFSEELKREITSFGKGAEIQDLPARSRAGYHMILSCPGLIRPVYRVYRPVRTCILKVTGR